MDFVALVQLAVVDKWPERTKILLIVRFLHAINSLIWNDGARPALVVLRVILDQEQLRRLLNHLTLLEQVDAAVDLRQEGVLVVNRTGRVARQQVVVGSAGGVRELANSRRILVSTNGAVGRSLASQCKGGERDRSRRHERHAVVVRPAVVVPSRSPRLGRRLNHMP